ncbi:MAG: hypothetical protein R6U17_09500 [Thermoplasmata archaeon]
MGVIKFTNPHSILLSNFLYLAQEKDRASSPKEKYPPPGSEEEKHESSAQIKAEINTLTTELRNLIINARANEIDVADANEMINMAKIFANNRSYKKAKTLLIDGIDHIESVINEEIIKRISSMEKSLENIGDEKTKKESRKHLELAKEAWNSHDFQEAFAQLSTAVKRSEEGKSSKEKAIDNIESLTRLVEKLEFIGVDVGEAYDVLNRGKEKVENSSNEEGTGIAVKTEKKIMEDIPDKLKKIVKETEDELQEAKLSGKNVSMHIFLLKQANSSLRKNDVKKSVEYIKKYKEEMQRLS